MNRRPAGALIGLAGVALALSACGTTVSPSRAARLAQGAGAVGSGDSGFSQPTGTTTTGQLGSAGALPGGAAAGSGTTGSGAPGSATGNPSGGAGTPTAGSGPSTVRVPNGNLKIGVQYGLNNDKAHAAFGTGAKDVPSGQNMMAWYRAAFNDVNAHGGIYGRKIEPVFYPFDATSTQSNAQQDQAACAAFTQDNHVFAALVGGFHTETILSCLSKAGVYIMAPGGMAFDDATILQRYPNFAIAGALQLHRMAEVYITGLVQQGFLKTTSKIGLVTYDAPEFVRANEQVLKPTLAKYGMKVIEEVRVNELTTLGAAGGAASSIGSAILRFRASGVDHVLFFASSGMAFVFMTAAESQSYRPLYGLNTNDTPTALAGTAPAKQLAGSVGVGWVPSFDIPPTPPTVAGKYCREVIRKATGSPSEFALSICDQVFLFANAARGASVLTPSGVSAGLQSLGNVAMASLPRTFYGRGLRDGVTEARYLAFGVACACYKYTSAPYQI